jgi:transcriptional antiterminator NusG
MKWFVIRVVSGKEKKVKELIETQLRITNKNNVLSNLLIPTQKSVEVRRGKKVNVDKNFFPGYIFVECESIDEVEANIKHVNGVASILKQPMTAKETERFLIKDEKPSTEEILYLNQRVKIIDGPFTSFAGTIMELEPNKQKVKVSISIFERETMLDLSFSQVSREEQ